MQVDRLSDEQIAPFQALIKDAMKDIKKDYGREACEAFGIEWDVDE